MCTLLNPEDEQKLQRRVGSRLLTPEAEEKLKSQLKPLWEQRLAYRNMTYKDIAEKLQFGKPPYEKLKIDHVAYYGEKFGFEIRHIKNHHYRTEPNHSEPPPLLTLNEEEKLREDMRPLYFAGFTAPRIAEVLHISECHISHYLNKFFRPRLLNKTPPPHYIQSLKTRTARTETPETPEMDMLITVISK